MNILFFNRSFYPDVEATGQFLTELCEDLIKIGHKVTVIASKPYHVKSRKFTFFVEFDKYNSIEIIRVSGTKFSKRFLLLRLINLGTYFLFAFIAGFFLKNKPNIVVAQTDPPLLGLLGLFFSKWYKAKFVYSCKDIYPDVGIITGRLKNPILNFILEKVNLTSCMFSDKIICLGEDMKKKIINKKIDQGKIIVIHDWADTNSLYPVSEKDNYFKIKHNLQNHFIIMYSGNIGLTQELEKIIDIAENFKTKQVLFVFVGEGAEKLKLQRIVEEKNLKNVIFLPYQPKEELKYSLSAPDIHLVTLQKGLAGVVVPSKIYGILACSKPFIAWIDEESEIYTIVKEHECGILISPENYEGVTKAIEWAMSNPDKLVEMGNRGREAAVKCFDRKISVEKFNNLVLALKSTL